MNRPDPATDPCSLARGLAEVGDWWSLMIIREAMYGTRRFSDFQSHLGVARNILTDRLNKLVGNDILRKVDVGERGTRFEYRLTDKGRDLFVVLTALRQWADKWVFNDLPPLQLIDRQNGNPVQRVQVLDSNGNPIKLHQVTIAEAFINPQ
ncbi:MAG: transcriptional regulator [Gammaproteobacteria bacterium HGW-Gammaproteobacteria-14]|nr:MAG: transcriptional regulator [Gammaproteobacteria bacterium HGW-Gammaproteobacteria-14]